MDRSKRKPWYRARNVVLALLLLLVGFVTWAGWVAYRTMYAEPVLSVDYGKKTEELIRERQGMPADAENGWKTLCAVCESFEERVRAIEEHASTEDKEARVNFALLFDPTAQFEGDLTRAEAVALAQAALSQLKAEGAFDEHSKLTSIKHAYRERQDGPLIWWLVPELGRSRTIAKATTARMFLACAANDQSEHAAALEETLAISRLLSHLPNLIDRLVSYTILVMGLRELRIELTEHPPEAAQCRCLLDAMDRQSNRGRLGIAFEAEKLWALDIVQRTFSNEGSGNGRLIITELSNVVPEAIAPPPRAYNLRGLILPDRHYNVQKINEFWDNSARLADLPRPTRLLDPFDADVFADKLQPSLTVVGIMLPASSKAFRVQDEAELNIAGTRLMLAIELHRAQTGRYPSSIEDLVPSELAQMPLDPFTGLPFGYKRFSAGEDPDDRGYLLYSLGQDGVDNGGASASFPPDSLHSSKSTGTDFVINSVREKPESTHPTKQEN